MSGAGTPRLDPARIAGSHHIYGKPGQTARLSVPCHGARPLKLGLFRALMKAAGLTEADL